MVDSGMYRSSESVGEDPVFMQPYDEINDSFKLRGMVTGGLLKVCVTATSFYRPRKVVKTAYWLGE
jgi:hypothetical protein